MSLSDFAALSTAISGIVVTASLIYLAIQTRQNTRNIRAQIQQGAASRTASIMLGMMADENIKTWIQGNRGEVTPEAICEERFGRQCELALYALEDHFHQHEAGLLNEEHFHRNMETFRALFSQSGMRGYWESQRSAISRVAPRFCAFVDDLCKPRPVSTNAG